MIPAPQRPSHVPPYAEACLRAVVAHGLGRAISLGGAFGLLHYHDYRTTHDVDAWWAGDATGDQQRHVLAAVEEALGRFGQVRMRSWGDVSSVELLVDEKAVFSFQIARRSAQLEPSAAAPWVPVLLDSLPDLLASKMVALVERGAPRDFRDVYALCAAGLTTASECWTLWQRRQTMAGSDTSSQRAVMAVTTHLARIAQHRPLEKIGDPNQRAEAERVRGWFSKEFLHALGS